MVKKILYVSTIIFLLASAQQALAQGVGEEGFVGPGECTTREECREYCDEDANKEECLTFAVEKGMMTQEEADKARKFLSQTGPGGCRGDECKDYCEDPAKMEECIKFAEEAGLIKPGEGARFRKLREISEKGGPGGCKGEECRKYCEDEAHRDECFAFARENNILTPEQIEGFEIGQKINKQIKEKGGPGNCRSEDECHQYCANPSHIDECAAFGAQHTGKSPEEMRRMLERFNKEGYSMEGPGAPEGFQERREEFERRLREEAGFRERMMREGFREAPEGSGPESFEGAGQNFQGPGGCNSPESCRAYCMSNPQVCGYGEGRPPEAGELPLMPPEGFQAMPGQYEGMQEMMTPPPGDFRMEPTSYDHSRSFLANVWDAFMAPFRK